MGDEAKQALRSVAEGRAASSSTSGVEISQFTVRHTD